MLHGHSTRRLRRSERCRGSNAASGVGSGPYYASAASDGAHPAESPGSGIGDDVTALTQVCNRSFAESRLDDEPARFPLAWCERRWKRGGVPHGCINCRLQIQAADGVRKPEAQLPLVLLIAARRPES